MVNNTICTTTNRKSITFILSLCRHARLEQNPFDLRIYRMFFFLLLLFCPGRSSCKSSLVPSPCRLLTLFRFITLMQSAVDGDAALPRPLMVLQPHKRTRNNIIQDVTSADSLLSVMCVARCAKTLKRCEA